MKFDYRADPILGETLAYWQGKRGNRSMPSRRDIDPAEIPKLLPQLQLIEMIGERYRYRLVGTSLVQAFGKDYTGKHADEVSDAARAGAISRIYRLVQEKRQPVFLRSSYVAGKNELIANRLYLPLSNDDRTVGMILGALTFEFLKPIAGEWGSAQLAFFESQVEMVETRQALAPHR